MNGVYKIEDITYDFSQHGRNVTLRCTKCGRIIHRTMIKGRNKWRELIKSCPCETERKKREEFEKSEKNKKAHIEELKSRIGMIFGDYEVESLEDIDDRPKYLLKCTECGFEKLVSANSFSKIKNFHCTKHFAQKIKYDENYIGKKNNFLTVIEISRFPDGEKAFLCRCDCGNEKLIQPTAWEQGVVRSCGCKRKELLSETNIEHGHSGDRLYQVWSGMKQRCCNPNNPNYENYGGRGIRVCEEWMNDFMSFHDWSMENGYDYDAEFGICTIDRINVNGNYEPKNCRWIDIVEQIKNKRPSEEWKRRGKKFKYNGAEYRLLELSTVFGVSVPTIQYRVKHLGMTLEEALNTPKMTDGRPRKQSSQF